MSRTYQTTGINLKSIPFGEADRLLTILSPEYGIIRAVAGGARKHNSRLRGRSEQFVINQLLLVEGKSLDKLTQAETQTCHPGLSRDLGKLAAAQYLAELAIRLGESDRPQELYSLFLEHLQRLEQLPSALGLAPMPLLLPRLTHGLYHLLALEGVAPQVQSCCLTHRPLIPDLPNPHANIGFSHEAGGAVLLEAVREQGAAIAAIGINSRLNGRELFLLQALARESLYEQHLSAQNTDAWIKVERVLRQYVQQYFGHPIRSAALVDTLLTVPS